MKDWEAEPPVQCVPRQEPGNESSRSGVCRELIFALNLIADVVDEIENITHNYNFKEAMIHVALSMPSRIYSSIPLAALTGCLIGLGQLAGASELVIMRAAGVSVARISWEYLMT